MIYVVDVIAVGPMTETAEFIEPVVSFRQMKRDTEIIRMVLLPHSISTTMEVVLSLRRVEPL